MTAIRVSFVDVYVLRGADATLEVLALRRAQGRQRPGSWETVHGHIDDGEKPQDAALRELKEETGFEPRSFYSLSRVDAMYLHRRDELAMIPVFVAFVDPQASIQLSEEHDASEWLPARQAAARFAWPREARALEDAVRLLGSGDAGPVEDVLRIC